MHIKVVLIPSFELSQQLGRIEGSLSLLHERINTMSQQMDDLNAKLTALETVEASAVTLLQTLKSELDTALAAGDLPAIQALSDRIGTDTDSLAAAVAANTPAAPPAGPQAA